jgi:hypothetical protein
MRNDGLQKFPNLFSGSNLVGNRHNQLSAISRQPSGKPAHVRLMLNANGNFSFFRKKTSDSYLRYRFSDTKNFKKPEAPSMGRFYLMADG